MTFGELIEGLSKKLGVEIEDAGGAFALEIDGQTVVLQQADDDLVLIRADLGVVPPDRRDTFASAALEANFLYRGTGGSTLAVNPNDGHLHLQKYNWLRRVDVDKAFEMLSRFAETSAVWKRLVAEVPSVEGGFAPPPDVVSGGFLQV